MSDKDSNDGCLQIPATQTEAIVKLLEKLNETMEKTREEQNTRMEAQNTRIEEQNTRIEEQNTRIEELVTEMKTLVENANSKPELVSLMKSQNEIMKEMSSAVKTLEKNSNLDHDDKPFPRHELEAHEPGWRAAFETLMARTKDQVERWRNGMDSTLIFVALFLTVITAFQGPVSQNLTQNPADLTNTILGNLTTIVYEIAVLNGLKTPGGLPQPEPFRPDRTDQVVTLFFYTALLLSLITAVLSVFGRQWVEHLTKKPEEQSYKDRSWRLAIRGKLAEKLLRPLLDSLHPILIVSIILFIVGLLYQLWSTSFSTGKPAVLMLTSSLGSTLILGTAVVTAYTFVHGVCWEESPFTTSTSLGIRRLIAPRHVKPVSKIDDETSLYPLFCSTVKQMSETLHFDQASSVPFSKLLFLNEIDCIELVVDTIVSVLGSDASLKAKQTVAWDLCTYPWCIYQAVRENVVDCHQRLYDALKSAEVDTPANQEKVKMTLLVARFVVLLRFSGVGIFLYLLENREIKKVCFEIFKLDPKICIDRRILGEAKIVADSICRNLEKEDPHLFDDVNDDVDVLPTILREEVGNSRIQLWKGSILQRLNDENITKILQLISTESLKINADYFHLFEILLLVFKSHNFSFVFPANFDISNLIKFATTHERRFSSLSGDVRVGDQYSEDYTPVNIVFSCLSLMDDDLLNAQQLDLLDFLASLEGHEREIYDIRVESPLASADIVQLRNRVAALSFSCQ